MASHVDRIPPFDPTRRAHCWLMFVGYHVDPSDVDSMRLLNQENLGIVTGPGCYYCEKLYSPLTADLACRGHPSRGI